MGAAISTISPFAAGIFFLAAFSAGFLLPAASARACSCAMPKPPQESLQEAVAVFSGRVASVKTETSLFSSSSLDPVWVTFEVDRWWKGPGSNRVTVKTAREGASCGYGFVEGREYFVYAYASSEGSDLRVSSCSRTNPMELARDDIAALGEGKALPGEHAPAPVAAPGFPLTTGTTAALLAAAFFAGAVAYWFFRDRSR